MDRVCVGGVSSSTQIFITWTRLRSTIVDGLLLVAVAYGMPLNKAIPNDGTITLSASATRICYTAKNPMLLYANFNALVLPSSMPSFLTVTT